MTELCGRPMRTGTCNMEKGHRGRCTTVAWECDGCGKRRRGQPAQTHPEAGWYCFMCVVDFIKEFGGYRYGPRRWRIR